jgi:peptide-methionine (S)-S-oxide reductase
MKNLLIISSLLFAFSLSACSNGSTPKEVTSQDEILEKRIEKQDYSQEEGLKTAYFASGCFWCVEAVFQSVKGVKDAISGYSGGEIKNPTYKQVSSGSTKHAEAIKVIYDPLQVDFETLVKVFFGSHDPTTPNQQGPDRGSQYRSIAFYSSPKEREIIEAYIKQLEEEKAFAAPIVTEVVPFKVFWEAEDYHQEYERLHPDNPYVKSVSIPRLRRFQAKYPELLKEGH